MQDHVLIGYFIGHPFSSKAFQLRVIQHGACLCLCVAMLYCSMSASNMVMGLVSASVGVSNGSSIMSN